MRPGERTTKQSATMEQRSPGKKKEKRDGTGMINDVKLGNRRSVRSVFLHNDLTAGEDLGIKDQRRKRVGV